MTTQSIISNTWMDAEGVSSTSPVANKTYYRYEERIENCGYFDPDGDYFYRSETNRCRVVLFDFPVKAETRCGVWISDRLGMRKWINSSWNKRYAHPTKEEAWTSFVARKKRQHRLLYARLAAIESLLEMPLPTDEEFASHLPHQTARTTYAPSAPPSKAPSALKGAGATPHGDPRPMSYLIAGYIFVGACYATASWITLKADRKNKALIASLRKEGSLIKGIVLLMILAAVCMWPFSLVTRPFVLLFRHATSTETPTNAH